jgi:hypothetical protein
MVPRICFKAQLMIGVRITLFLAVLAAMIVTGCKRGVVALGILDREGNVRTYDGENYRMEARLLTEEGAHVKATGIQDGMILILSVSPKNASDPFDFSNDPTYGNKSGNSNSQREIQDFRDNLKEKIWVEWGNVKIPLSNLVVENTFGMGRSRNFSLLFPKSSFAGETKFTLVLDEIVPGSNRVKLNFEIPSEKYAKAN